MQQINKSTYKVQLIILKYSPIILAILDLIYTIFSYYEIQVDIISFIGGVSVLSLFYLYTSSYVFKFCSTHRIPLHYVVANNLVSLIDMYIGVPLSDRLMLCFYFIIAGIFTILYVYCKVKYKNKELCFS